MAKQKLQPNSDNSAAVKKVIENLQAAIASMSKESKEQIRLHKELLKVISILQAGFANNAQDAGALIVRVQNGLEVTDEFAKKWATQRKATQKDIDELIKKFRELDDLQEKIVDKSKESNKETKVHIELLTSEIDLSKRLLLNQGKIADAIKASKDEASKLTGVSGNINDVIEELVQQKVNLSSLFNGMNTNLESGQGLVDKMKSDIQSLILNASDSIIDIGFHFNPYSAQLDREIKKTIENIDIEKTSRIESLEEFFKLNSKLQKQAARQMAANMSGMNVKINVDSEDIETANGLVLKGTSAYNDLIEKLDEIAAKNKIVGKLSKSFAAISKNIKLGADRTQEQYDELNRLLEPMGLSTKILVDQISQRYNELELIQKSIVKQKEVIQVMSQYTKQLHSADSIVMKIGYGFDYINAILPAGIGEFLGISKVSAELIKSHKVGVEGFAASISEGATAAQAMKSYMEAFRPALSLALNPMLLLVAAAVLLFKFVEGIVQDYKDMSKEMKISLIQAKQLLNTQIDILTSQKNQFATMEDIQSVQTAMIASGGKVFDLTNKASKELTISLIETGKAFGYGTEQAVQLHKQFRTLGADDSLALNLERNLGLMSEMAGLSPQIVAEEMIAGAETVSIYFAGLPDKAAKAAIQIKRMGLSLQKAGEIAQKMLDLEGFMTDMYELQAMSGGGIDFSRAFDKGLMGDIQGMTEEIMKNVGSTDEFSKMDYLTRVKISKTLGMSVDELAKSVKLREDMQGLGESEQSYLKANLDRMGDMSNLSQDEIRNRLQQLQSTDRLGVAWDKIKGVLIKALIPLAEGLANIIDGISPLLDVIILALKGIAGILKIIAPLFKLITTPLKWIGDGLSLIIGKIDSFVGGLEEVSPVIADITKGAIGFITLFGGTTILKNLGLIKTSLVDWIKFFPTIFSSVFGGITSFITKTIPNIIGGIGNIFKALFVPVSTSSTKAMTDIKTTSQEAINSVANTAKKTSDISKSAVSSIANSVTTQTTQVSTAANKMTGSVETATGKVRKNLSKKSKLGLIDPTEAKSGFGTIGKIASTTFAIMATRSALSFLQMRKEGEAQSSIMSENMINMLDFAFTGAAPLLGSYLADGIERVFIKKIEKGIGDKGIFGQLISSGKGAFSKIVEFGKKILPGPTSVLSTSFDKMATKVKSSTETIADAGKNVKEILPKIEQTQTIDKTIKRRKTEAIETTTRSKSTKLPTNAKRTISTVGKSISDGFNVITNIIESTWKTLRGILTDIVKFISTSMKELSSGIGVSFKNILKGIGDGLSSFKTNAIKGAAALVIVSGALWITSKALQNFAQVKWEDVGKGMTAIGGLVLFSMLLGNAAPQMIVGALGIAIMGAALIPLAYALNMFNSIEWSALGKAGVALLGLSVAVVALGAIMMSGIGAAAIILGAAALAIMGAALIPLAYGMKMLSDVNWDVLGAASKDILKFGFAAATFGILAPSLLIGSIALGAASLSLLAFSSSVIILSAAIEGVDTTPIRALTNDLMGLTSIPISNLFGVAAGITALGISLISFNALSSVGNIIGKIFGGDPLRDLEKLGNLADPLYLVNKVILELGNSLQILTESLSTLDLSQLDKLKEIGKLGIDTQVQQKIEPMMNIPNRIERDNTQVQNIKIAPIQIPIAKANPPRKEAVAQDKRIDAITKKTVEIDEKTNKPLTQPKFALQETQGRFQQEDIYREDVMSDTATIEMLLRQNNQLLELILRKDSNIVLDKQRVGSILKARNNNV